MNAPELLSTTQHFVYGTDGPVVVNQDGHRVRVTDVEVSTVVGEQPTVEVRGLRVNLDGTNDARHRYTVLVWNMDAQFLALVQP